MNCIKDTYKSWTKEDLIKALEMGKAAIDKVYELQMKALKEKFTQNEH